ncbi:MAG: hypothetical protein IKA51_00620 [Clostridia bacterium]|nr:hypothetical protein [Clostridia bacterium]
MKKILTFIFVVLLCVGLCLPALAAAPTATVSDDLRTVYFNETEYLRFNAEYLVDDTRQMVNVKLSESQKTEIKEVKLYSDYTYCVIRGVFKYADGTELTAYYIIKDAYSDAAKIINGKNVEAVINFINVPDLTVNMNGLKSGSEESFLRENTTLTFDVYAYAANGYVKFKIGYLAVYKGNYYYCDYAENEENSGSVPKARLVHPSSDLYKKIDASVNDYYNTGFGFLYYDDLVTVIAIILLLLLFIVAPAVIAVIFTVLAIIKKGTYRKIYIVIASLSAALLIVSVIISVII